jgi:hypothetical protein
MNLTLGKFTHLIAAALITLTTACSSGGGDSTPAIVNATITDENAQDLATAATEGIKQAVNSDSYTPFAKTDNESPIEKVTVLAAQQASQQPALAEDFNFCETGSVSGFDTLGQTGGTVTYDQCVIAGATIDGTMVISTSTSGSTTTYSIIANFTISYLSEVETINYTATCTLDQNAGTTSCSFSSSGSGIDGRTYTVSNIDIDGNEFTGYTVSATVTDPDHGNITISTSTPVTFNCTNGQPDAGDITVSDGSNTMTVTFIDCTSFSLTFDGSTTTYNW